MNLEYLVFLVICATSLGLTHQCLDNMKRQRAAFLAFPMAALILLPYPLWGLLASLTNDWRLFSISLIMGVPSAWLAIQFFQYEWHRKAGLKAEDKATLFLVLIGVLALGLISGYASLEVGLAAVAAYLTCCISIFSYLVKIWRVNRGHESLEGLKWSTLITLGIFYCVMIYVGQLSDVLMLSLSYVFSVFAVMLAIAYKALNQGRREVRSTIPR